MYNTLSLEYDKVLEILAGLCLSECSRDVLRTLSPDDSRERVTQRLEELGELLLLIAKDAYPDLAVVHDTARFIHKAEIENNFLNPQEILLIRENLGTYFRIRKTWATHFPEVPLLSAKVESVRAPVKLAETIDRAVDERGNVREDASPALREIADRMRELRRQIENVLEGYFNSAETRQFIQERNITFKDDRYVIPVKQNFKGRIPGIIHAYSGSGQTLFLEPFSITERNNELKLLQKEREKEIERILIDLTGEIGSWVPELSRLQKLLMEIDILLAKARFMEERGCTIPEIGGEREILLKESRHPLIQGDVVPIDFRVEPGTKGVVITGPNTGGKTVSLKTVGLLVLLAQSGIPVPARYMRTYIFDSVYADIGDEQSIEQSLSTFSGHIKNIKRIVEGATSRSLVLIDELGAGTDPIEGGAIGTAILDYLNNRDILTIVTTHFGTIKVYALANDGIKVASVQFDSVTCRPTYKLVMGIPGRSNAIEIAEGLGLKREILDRTLEFLGEKDRSIDDVLKNLGLLERKLSDREAALFEQETGLRALVRGYTEKLAGVEEREAALRSGYKRELAQMLSDFRKRLEGSIGAVRKSGASQEAISSAREELKKVDVDFLAYERDKGLAGSGAPAAFREGGGAAGQGCPETKGGTVNAGRDAPLKAGDRVTFLSDFGDRLKGVVEEMGEGSVTVRAGILKMKVDRNKVVRAGEGREKTAGSWEFEATNSRTSAAECDLRGMRYEEAMNELVKHLDGAMLGNLETVSIIHGLGTGALRKGVWDTLSRLKYVERFGYALPEMGGFGCTVVKLRR